MKRTTRKCVTLALSLLMLLSLVWTSQSALASDPPTFTADITNTHKITLTFNKEMTDPWGLGGGGFSYTINGTPQTVSSIAFISGPTVYVLELHAGIQPGDIVTLSYTPLEITPIKSTDDGYLQEFSGLALTNNLSTAAPYIFVASTQDGNLSNNNDGTYLLAAFSLAMADPPAAPGGFTVNIVDAAGVVISTLPINSITGMTFAGQTSMHSYLFRLGTPILYGQDVRISYTPGSVQSAYGVAMAADSLHHVSNNLPQPVSADLTNIALSGDPSGFTFVGGTYSYNDVTVANDVAGITVTPTGAGTITVDGTEVASGAASGEIALTADVQRTILVTTTETGKAVKTYTIKVTRLGPQATPTFSPAQGAVALGSTLQIISAGAEDIYYTIDGTEPGTSAVGATLEYNDANRPVIDQPMTVKAIAVKAGRPNSAVATAVYTQAASSNLTGLVLSGNPAGFTFAGGTYTYNNVTVANSVTGIAVTPTGAGIITVNGTAVISGNASDEIALTPGTEETMTITATETGKSPVTYIIKVTRAADPPVIGPIEPTYDAEIEGGSNLTVTVDEGTDNASVDIGALGGSVAGGGSETIVMPAVPGATNYTLGISAENLSVQGGTGSLTFTTETGSMTLPSDMLAGIAGADGKKAEITIGAGDTSALPDEVKAAIGDRPLIQLTLTMDGQQTDWNNPGAPVTVSVPYTPTAEELENPESIVIWYIDGSGNAVSVPNGRYDPLTGTVTFSTTHFSLFAVNYNKVVFNDVAVGVWYDKAVGFIAARGIAGGTGDGRFSPDALLTRGEFIVMLMRAYGIEPDATPLDNFIDAGDTYYTGYLAAAKRLGIASGIGDNMYAPTREITRQEMFTLLYNALKHIGQLPQGNSAKTLPDFTDADSVADWAKDALALLVETGTISGSGGKLNPAGTATRAEMAQTLYNLLGN